MRHPFLLRWTLGPLLVVGLAACGSQSPPEDPPPPPPTPLEINETRAKDIQATGGKVKVDESHPEKPLLEIDLHRTPTKSSDLIFLEDDNFKTLQSLNLNGCTDLDDLGLEYLHKLTNLRVLLLNSCPITDQGVAHLKGLTQLEELQLLNTLITDAGLENLKGLTNLHTLKLGGSRVTKAGMEKLQKALPKTKIAR